MILRILDKKIILTNLNAEKWERRDPLGFCNIHSLAKCQKKLKGDPS